MPSARSRPGCVEQGAGACRAVCPRHEILTARRPARLAGLSPRHFRAVVQPADSVVVGDAGSAAADSRLSWRPLVAAADFELPVLRCATTALAVRAGALAAAVPEHAGLQQRAVRRRLRPGQLAATEPGSKERQGGESVREVAAAGASRGSVCRSFTQRAGDCTRARRKRGRHTSTPSPRVAPAFRLPPRSRASLSASLAQSGKVSTGKSTYRGVRQRPWGKVRTSGGHSALLDSDSSPAQTSWGAPRDSLPVSARLYTCAVRGRDPRPDSWGARVAGHLR